MKKFEYPDLEIEKLDLIDIIVTSGDDEDDWTGNTGGNMTPWN